MKMYFNHWLFKLPFISNYDAMVIGRVGIFKDSEQNTPKYLISHELVHQKQMDEHGVIRFYLIYLKDYIINLIKYWNHDKAYRNIPFEIEAYKLQD